MLTNMMIIDDDGDDRWSVHFSSVSWPIGWSGGHEGPIRRDPLPAFPAGSPCEQFWHGQECPLFDVVHPAFPLLTTELPTFQGALKDGSGVAVAVCDMSNHATRQFTPSFQFPAQRSRGWPLAGGQWIRSALPGPAKSALLAASSSKMCLGRELIARYCRHNVWLWLKLVHCGWE